MEDRSGDNKIIPGRRKPAAQIVADIQPYCGKRIVAIYIHDIVTAVNVCRVCRAAKFQDPAGNLRRNRGNVLVDIVPSYRYSLMNSEIWIYGINTFYRET